MTSVLACHKHTDTIVFVNEGMFILCSIQIRNESEKAKIVFHQRRGPLVYHLE